MKQRIRRVVGAAVLVGIAGTVAPAEDYQCHEAGGCSATITEDGVEREVSFRKGDLVSTDSGWVVTPEGGWVKVRTAVGLGSH